MWLQCDECKTLNYRTNVRVAGGTPKLEMAKFCSKDRKHTTHKLKKK